MISEKTHDWFQLVGMAAVVASLIFVGLQLKQSDEIAMVELLDNAADRNLELSALRASYADIWQRACAGDELSPSEKIIASSIYFSFVSNNWNAWARTRATGYGLAKPEYFTDRVAANIYRYPGLREIARSYRDWRTDTSELDAELMPIFQEAIRSRLAELDRQGMKSEYDVMWCGNQ